MAYRGDFSLTLETYLDPREAAGWSRIDKALSFVQVGQWTVKQTRVAQLVPSSFLAPVEEFCFRCF